ncbi:MAG: peptide deformylase [Actinobacteria bacterium RBG_13_63_9]|nr:MAG: peptide deformylase [Actinobacteria bacterium RBG_13_63_9]
MGDPVLKEQAKAVTVFDAKVRRLAALMTEVMEGEKGVGLAAPQLGVLARVIVWKNPDEADELHTFVNPQITERSEICSTETEGCLSVPGASVEVSRPEEVLVSAQNLGGQALEMRLAGLASRIVQHEVDHLDGCLILDRASPDERRRVMKELRERALAADT